MKLLCLHGYTQSAPQFQKRISVLTKALSKSIGIESIFVQGPHQATISFNFDTPQPEERAWWNASESQPISYIGLEESIKLLKEYSFDGILGFSQGSIMALIQASIMNPKYAIIISGFTPRDSMAREWINYKGRVLFVAGELDELVTLQTTIELARFLIEKNRDTFTSDKLERGITKLSPKVDFLVHDGGHVVPQKSEFKKMILDWIQTANKL
jgi:dihydrofolate reductase